MNKELILCALRNNIDKVKKDNGRLRLINKDLEVSIFRLPVYEFITTPFGRVFEKIVGFNYKVSAFNKEYEITEKEYLDFQEKIEEKQIEQLKKLCSE